VTAKLECSQLVKIPSWFIPKDTGEKSTNITNEWDIMKISSSGALIRANKQAPRLMPFTTIENIDWNHWPFEDNVARLQLHDNLVGKFKISARTCTFKGIRVNTGNIVYVDSANYYKITHIFVWSLSSLEAECYFVGEKLEKADIQLVSPFTQLKLPPIENTPILLSPKWVLSVFSSHITQEAPNSMFVVPIKE
jgi:hypothetical protein